MGALFSKSPQWSAEAVPDHTGKVVIVTGANTGIGKEIVRTLFARNAKVYLACRTQSRAEEAMNELRAAAPASTGELVFLQMDLSDLASVRRAAAEFLEKERELHALYNNAGVATTAQRPTADGFEPHFGVNVIGHFLFTTSLLPALRAATAASSGADKARVIHLSSGAAFQATMDYKPLVVPTGQEWKAPGSFGALKLYAVSKLGNAIVAREMARRYGDVLVSIAVHPGAIDSEISREAPEWVVRLLRAVFFHPSSYGALTPLWAGTTPEAAVLNGKFIDPVGILKKMPGDAENPQKGEQLWAWLVEKTKASETDA